MILGRWTPRAAPPEAPPHRVPFEELTDADLPYGESEIYRRMRSWAAAGYEWKHVRHELSELLGVPLPDHVDDPSSHHSGTDIPHAAERPTR